MLKLNFGVANAKLVKLEKKLNKKVYTFSTLSGFSCCGANKCLSFAVENNGKRHIQDGKNMEFRCFSASQEVLYTNVYNSRKENMEIIKLAAISISEAAKTILAQIPKKCEVLRINVAGDFQTLAYFDAWILVANSRPDILFYAYTKSIPFWIARLGNIPSNLVLTASLGGRFDELAISHNLRTARVVYSTYEARKLKLPIDKDDSHAAKNGGSFALLLHGQMAKGSKASKAWQRIKSNRVNGGYSKKRNTTRKGAVSV